LFLLLLWLFSIFSFFAVTRLVPPPPTEGLAHVQQSALSAPRHTWLPAAAVKRVSWRQMQQDEEVP
jgi:hypothetical protein